MLYILHLSDIHFGCAGNYAARRLPQLIKAATSRINKGSEVIIALTGDVAQAGQRAEYDEATAYLSQLRSALLERNCTLHMLIAPGNHDCDLSGPIPGRDEALRQRSLDVAPASLHILATPQRAYHDFFKANATQGSVKATDEVRTVFQFKTNSGYSVFAQAINSSLYFTKEVRKPGELWLPTGEYSIPEPNADFHLTLMHHPAHWFDPVQASSLREALESSTDIILTGHEHVGFASAQENLDSISSHIHLEGIALQGDSRDDSGFYLLAVDGPRRQFSTMRFQWRGERYSPLRKLRSGDLRHTS